MTKINIMVTIYALIDLRTNEPFYVGASNNMKQRISCHIRDAIGNKEQRRHGSTATFSRHQVINELLGEGIELEYVSLLVVPPHAANKCEKYIYTLLIKHGFTLYQVANRFNWSNSYKGL